MRRFLFWTAVLACLAVIAGGGWYVYSGYRAPARPQDAVRDYFAAVQRGDAAGALSLGPVPTGASRAWLTGAVLAQQLRVAPLHTVTIGRVHRTGKDATVEVGYRLRFADGDRGEQTTVGVHKVGSRWLLTQTTVPTSVVVEQAQDRVTLAGSAVPGGRVLLFPGALPVRLDTPFLQASPAAVALGSTGRTFVTVTPTARAQRTIAANVTSQLTACVSASRRSPDCPLPSARTVPGSLQGHLDTVDRHVHVALESGAAGLLDVRGSITVRGTYRTLTYDNTEQVRTGRVTLPFHATASPFAPLTVRFEGDT